MSKSKISIQRPELSPAKLALLKRRMRGDLGVLDRDIIPRRAKEEFTELSFAQQRLWFIDQLGNQKSIYNLPAPFRLKGGLDVQALKQSVGEIVQRHESLRTTFAEVDGKPVQIVQPAGSWRMELVDLSHLSEADKLAEARRLAREEAHRPFDLQQGPVLRTALLKLAEDDHILLLTVHHIVSDAWSMGVIFKELSRLYARKVQTEQLELEELPLQYRDYAVWQREWLGGGELERQLAYWKNQLQGMTVLEMPTDRVRPAVQTHRGNIETTIISAKVAAGLRELSRREGVTMYMTLLAAFNVLLYRYSGQPDISIGTAIANRNRPDLEGIVGFFVNTLVMRSDLSGNPSFNELLQRVKQLSLEAYAHQDMPFEKLVEELRPERDLSHNPLFQVAFSLQNAPTNKLALLGLKVSRFASGLKTIKTDLEMHIKEFGAGIRVMLDYNSDLYDSETIGRMLGHYEMLLGSIITNSEKRISELELIDKREQEQSLITWNDTAREYESDKCIHEVIRTHAEQTPDSTAIAYADQRMTYRWLNQRSNQLAWYLRKKGVGPEVPVGICLERGFDLVASLLAVLKAGGAFVPLDPAYPTERLAFMLADSGAKVVLTQAKLKAVVDGHGIDIIRLDADAQAIDKESHADPGKVVDLDNLAYVIYTSGSTGRPKGVGVSHRGIGNLVQAQMDRFSVARDSRILQFASFSFDASVWEIFMALGTGASLYMASPESLLPGEALRDLLRDHAITTVTLPPSVLAAMPPDKFPALETVIAAGETCSANLTQRWAVDQHFYNAYGPTEVTVCATIGKCAAGDPKPLIGLPINNTQVYLLGPQLTPVPFGVPGVMYVAGVGLARGYVGQPAATAEQFVPDAFSEVAGRRLYKTGDLAKRLPEGNFEFIGRGDSQVKIRGFRIELGEVEAILRQHPAVSDAVVTPVELASGEKYLAAFVVLDQRPNTTSAHDPDQPALSPAREGSLPTDATGLSGLNHHEKVVEELNLYLRRRLPGFLVPASLRVLGDLPLTPSGKVDRRALSMLGQTSAPVDGLAAPRTPIEELLLEIWSELFGCEAIGLHDNFFALGGHSLLIVKLLSRVRQVFQVSLPLQTVFDNPTVASFARIVNEALGIEQPASQVASVKPARCENGFPLSHAQQRLWFIDQLEPGTPAYNMPVTLRLKGELDLAALANSLNEIVRRHNVLRTTFKEVELRPVQVIAEYRNVGLAVEDLTHLSWEEREREAKRQAKNESQQGFDLREGPLVRWRVLRLEAEEHVLLLTLHHIVSDGWSVGVLFRELTTLYEAYRKGESSPLGELGIQYGDYAVWQRDWLSGEELERQLGYWKKQLEGIQVLELPTDHVRPVRQRHRGASQAITISKEAADGLRELCRREGVTLYMTLLAAFKVLLRRYSGQENIVVGTPIANRSHAETEGLIGFFVNTLLLRSDVRDGLTFMELLRHVKGAALAAYTHQDMPFEKLVEELQPERDLSHNPLFQVAFSLQNVVTQLPKLQGLSVSGMPSDNTSVKVDLEFYLRETTGGIRALLVYNTELYEEGTIRRMLDHYRRILESVIANPALRLSAIPMLSPDEYHRAVGDANPTLTPVAPDQRLHEMVEQHAQQRPDAVAVVFDHAALTYAALNCRANQLARYLQRRRIGPECLVGISLEPGLDMVVVVLAILKAGGGYVPLDPAYPHARLRYMVADSALRVVITQQGLASWLGDWDGAQIALAQHAEQILVESDTNLARATAAENLAYVIYTSGSTGKPKGVMIGHAGLSNVIAASLRGFDISAASRVAQMASLSFDASVLEMFMGLGGGGRLEVINRETVMTRLGEKLRQAEVTAMALPPSLLETLEAGNYESLATIIVGGESCGEETAERWRTGRRMYNAYAPTEGTIYATVQECVEKQRGGPGIGRAIANSQAYVLDEEMGPVADGVVGEIYLGGVGLARGYVKRAEQTAERFVPNPYGGEGERLYRTGDRGRRGAAGELEYVGRNDRQVKVRGYRIELGEIEAVLEENARVKEAVVMVGEGEAGERQIVGYVVAREGQELVISELKRYAKEKLPGYMIPGEIVQLEEMPLTENGKVDREKLQEARGRRAGREEKRRPRTPVEELVVEMWEELLKVKEVGVGDNFFELGGHSLLATQVMSRVREVFGIEMGLRKLFEGATVEEFAREIEAGLGEARGEAARPMARVAREGGMPLSHAQQRMWVIDRLEPGTAAYNIPVARRLKGQLRLDLLEASLNEIVNRHEALRTTFEEEEGDPVQIIGAHKWMRLELEDLTCLPEPEREEEARKRAGEETRTGFDLSAGPLVRWKVLKLGDEEHVLLLTMHHIVSDAWSMGLLFKEMTALYDAYLNGHESPLPALEIQYADYAVWQREWLSGEELDRQMAYWKQQLAGMPLLEMPTDRLRPPVQSYRGASETIALNKQLLEALREFSRREAATLYMTLLAAFEILLHLYTNQDDLVIGTETANRRRVEVERLIGFFVNPLVLRCNLSGNPTFREILQRVREMTLDAYTHEDMPFEKLVEEIEFRRDLSYHPAYQVMFNFQRSLNKGAGLSGLKGTGVKFKRGVAQVDLTLYVFDRGDALMASLEYLTDLFNAGTIRRMLNHYERTLEKMVAEPDKRLASISLLTEKEKQQVLVEWNATEAPYPQEKCFIELFEEQVEKHPAAIAARQLDDAVTYGELNLRANRVARLLQQKGVGADGIVSLIAERSIGLLTAILGVWKAGAAYLPIDTTSPAVRTAEIIEQSGSRMILASKGMERLAQQATELLSESLRVEIAQIDEILDSGGDQEALLNLRGSARNLAYVIYTSGSTGKPKGAMIEQRGMMNHLVAKVRELRLSESDRIAEVASPSFDISVWQFMSGLLVGAAVEIVEDEKVRDAEGLVKVVAERGVTILEIVPTMLRGIEEWLDWAGEELPLPELRWLVVTGEALTADLTKKWRDRYPRVRMMNAYGPTECSDDVTHYEVQGGEEWAVPIGRAIQNTRLCVLDERLEAVAIGIPGELHVAGDGVGRGYLREAGRTAETFVPDPYSGESGGRLYRTGDKVKYREDGMLEFIGRRDKQIKVRGYRIELGEIEAVLAQHEAVREGVVIALEARGQKELVGYVVVTDEASAPSGSQLKEYLRERLPGYMTPVAIVRLDKMPLTANGKLDKRALPRPEESDRESEYYSAPRTPVEEVLVAIWEDVLGLDQVGINDNFFESGGQSLLATKVIARVRDTWQIEMAVRKVFECPTVAGFAAEMLKDPVQRLQVEKVTELLMRVAELSEEELEEMMPQNA